MPKMLYRTCGDIDLWIPETDIAEWLARHVKAKKDGIFSPAHKPNGDDLGDYWLAGC